MKINEHILSNLAMRQPPTVRSTSRARLKACVILLLLASASMPAQAALNVSEGMDYGPAGSFLVGKNGGDGFSGPWAPGGFNASISDNYKLTLDSLGFGGLPTSGASAEAGSVSAISGVTRTLAMSLGAPGTTAYLSFLLEPEGTLNEGAFNGFFGLYLDSVAATDIFIGKPGSSLNRYVMEDRGGTGQVATTLAPMVGETAFMVLKAEFRSGPDVFTLYTNPTPGGVEPAAGTVKSGVDAGEINALVLYSTGAYRIDEIRLGNTFADVAPVPEPASSVLMLLSGVACLAMRRRRRASR